MSILFKKKDISKILKEAEEGNKNGEGLHKVLGVKDLTFFGIAAIIGAGIFSTIGKASFNGGPAVTILFIFIAIACIFTALSYAQFASTVPVSGSAYTYTYVTFGEIFAWIIGWALILEYAVSNMVVAISWSGYFVSMLENVFHVHFPRWLAIDHSTAFEAYTAVSQNILPSGMTAFDETYTLLHKAYIEAPTFGGLKVIFNLPAGIITAMVTGLIYVGIKESRAVSNFLVYLKLGVILFVIVGGAFYVKGENWSPFLPNGVSGVMVSVAAVFFAFIGFDSISTTAEECKNPQRDLPRAMLYCLGICTVLYIIITLVLTGMVDYKDLNVADPLAFVFEKVGLNWVAGVISVSAVVAITSALLAYQLGQPRIWMTMSRDGLLPSLFSDIHKKYRTPWFSTLVTGLFVGIPSLFFNMNFFVDLTSVGTFFAFIVVCAGIIYMDNTGLSEKAKFKVFYIDAKYILIPLLILGIYLAFDNDLDLIALVKEKPLLVLFGVVWLGLIGFSFISKISSIPSLGILFNLYLMTELGISNWVIFLIWLVIGLFLYFGYMYYRLKIKLQNV
ncbi:MAG: amino acid permease [Leadbetterella sp.]